MRILQSQREMTMRLEELRQRWRRETVIHGDVKHDNVVAWRAEENTTEVRIVDWEMVKLGDPAWDLAGVLQDFVDFWVKSMPLFDDLPMDERMAKAHFPLTVVQGAIRSFWRGYLAAADLSCNHAEQLLQRGVEFSAARMIQTAYEVSYQLPVLSPRSVLLLQISANLLAEPERGRFQLYGIPLMLGRR
jgi:Ser/Thr protein kinase RdoA (MazF antagonist)